MSKEEEKSKSKQGFNSFQTKVWGPRQPKTAPKSYKKDFKQLIEHHVKQHQQTEQSRKRHQQKIAYKQQLLQVQSNCRFIMYPSRLAIEHFRDANCLLDWEGIAVIEYQINEELCCPICLEEEMVMPVITRCGHIFCYPCLLFYLTNDFKDINKCPICLTKMEVSEIMWCKLVKTQIETEAMEVQLCVRKKQELLVIPYQENNTKCGVLNTHLYNEEIQGMAPNMSVDVDENCHKFNRVLVLEQEASLHSDLVQEAERGLEYLTQTEQHEKAVFLEQILPTLRQKANIHISPNVSILQDSPNASTHYFFYQNSQGQAYYLLPKNFQMLVSEFGEFTSLPEKISGKVIHIETVQQTHFLQKRWSYLSHIPVGSFFSWVELDLSDYVSQNLITKNIGKAEEIQAAQLPEKHPISDVNLITQQQLPSNEEIPPMEETPEYYSVNEVEKQVEEEVYSEYMVKGERTLGSLISNIKAGKAKKNRKKKNH